MADNYNENNVARLKHLASLATRVKNELEALDGRKFGGVNVANGKINFYATSDTTAEPLESIDVAEEIFLDQASTAFVENFSWSSVAYPGSTNPNLDGKPVLVLGVKGDKITNPTIKYSFINLQKLVDTYTAANAGISIAGYSIGVKLSQGAGNILSIANDGLLGEMKIAGASAGNFAVFGASGAIVDSGITFASDTDVNSMITGIFGASGASGT